MIPCSICNGKGKTNIGEQIRCWNPACSGIFKEKKIIIKDKDKEIIMEDGMY